MWNIRLVSIGDLNKNNTPLERRILPIQGPTLIGTLGQYTGSSASYEIIKPEKDLEKKAGRPLAAIIKINPGYRHISKLHAVLETRQEQLYAEDLGSKNGTYLDGKKILPRTPAQIQDEQTLELGGFDKDSAKIKAYETAKEMHALLIGTDCKNNSRQKIDADITALTAMLKKIRAPLKIKTLLHEQATESAITHELRQAAEFPRNSLFFFYYNAHGSINEITTRTEEESISKFRIALLLSSIKAKKIMLIDACNAAGGWSFLEEDGIYFFSSAEDEISYWQRYTTEFAQKIKELLENRQPVDLKSLEIKVTEQTPTRTGNKSVILW